MSNMLVLYYSWSNGNTKAIAEKLAAAKGADLARIDTVVPYPDDYNTTVSQGQREVNNGVAMPQEGFGVYQISDPEECEAVTYNAIRLGYRLIDTAAAYGNEEALGRGIRRAIGEKYGKTAAQVVLRWNVQSGVSIIPKSVHVDRMQQNLDIWDFELTDDEMAQISSRDIGHSEIINHYDPSLVKFLNEMAIHD